MNKYEFAEVDIATYQRLRLPALGEPGEIHANCSLIECCRDGLAVGDSRVETRGEYGSR